MGPRLQYRLLLAALVVLIVLLAVPLALAAPTPKGENITASPTQIQPELAPGGTTSGVASIINDGEQAYDFKAYVTPYHVSGELYDPSFTAGSGVSAAPWVHVPDTSFHILPRQTITVPYAITVPIGTGGGGYYAVMFFETQPKPVAASGVASRQRVGILVYLRVNGTVTERGNVQSFTARLIQPGPPLTATLRLGNQGNVHYEADITAHVTDWFGRSKSDLHLVREVLPGTTRRVEVRWDKAPAFGLFHIGGVVNLLGRTAVLPGHYVLILSAGAFTAMSAALLLLVILVVWWWWGRRRR